MFSHLLEGITSKRFFGGKSLSPSSLEMHRERLFSHMRFNQSAKTCDIRRFPTLNYTSTSTFIIQLSKGLHLPGTSGKDQGFS